MYGFREHSRTGIVHPMKSHSISDYELLVDLCKKNCNFLKFKSNIFYFLGRGNPKGGKKGRKGSRANPTPTPPTPPPPQSVEEVKIAAQPVATVAEIPVPIPVKDVEPIATPVAPVVVPTPPAPVVDSPMVDVEIKVCFLFFCSQVFNVNNSLIIWFHFKKETPKPLPVVPESVVEKPSEKPVIAVEPESVITNGGKLGGVKLFF